MSEGPLARYRSLESEHSTLREAARIASVRMATIRAITFVASFAGGVVWTFGPEGLGRSGLFLGLILAVAFIVQVVLHARIGRRERWHAALEPLAREGQLRIHRDWDALGEALPARERTDLPLAPGHPFARDLGVQGRASLRRLLGPVTSEPGRQTLGRWLLEAATPGVAGERAEAVRELSPRNDERMTLAALGRQAKGADGAALERLLVWAEGEPSSLGGGWIRIAAYLLPVTLVVTILADVYLGAPALWIIPAVPQLWMLRRFNARLAPDFEAVASMGPALRTYGPQLESVAGWTGESACLQALLRRVSDSDSPAPAWLGELAGLADTAQSRTNMFYAVFAAFLLVDVHLGLRLERWRGLHGSKARDWLAALGEAEALSSLATLAHDQPEWTFPVWEGEGELSIEGQGLGHPLIPDASCVRNDVSLGPPGTFLLVTGSNMSGKSTLLRAIGTNVILAGAGAPVCAESLRLGPVRLCTSMSVEDSLEDGISLFMAQLLRVRDIVEIARKTEGGAAPVLFLLDEILHGTNSRERRVAAQAVVRHLLECGAIGTISTHDLELAEAPDLQDRAIPVHFREKVLREQGETRLEFDYLMRPGLAQSSNALALLEAVGLGDGGAD